MDWIKAAVWMSFWEITLFGVLFHCYLKSWVQSYLLSFVIFGPVAWLIGWLAWTMQRG